jgi:hypothetical protein
MGSESAHHLGAPCVIVCVRWIRDGLTKGSQRAHCLRPLGGLHAGPSGGLGLRAGKQVMADVGEAAVAPRHETHIG